MAREIRERFNAKEIFPPAPVPRLGVALLNRYASAPNGNTACRPAQTAHIITAGSLAGFHRSNLRA